MWSFCFFVFPLRSAAKLCGLRGGRTSAFFICGERKKKGTYWSWPGLWHFSIVLGPLAGRVLIFHVTPLEGCLHPSDVVAANGGHLHAPPGRERHHAGSEPPLPAATSHKWSQTRHCTVRLQQGYDIHPSPFPRQLRNVAIWLHSWNAHPLIRPTEKCFL